MAGSFEGTPGTIVVPYAIGWDRELRALRSPFFLVPVAVLLCLPAGYWSARGEASSAPLFLIYSHFEQAPPQAVVSAIRAETATILAPLELPYAWRSMDDVSPGREIASDLVVVKFQGQCDGSGVFQKAAGPLGWTHVSDGEVLPFIEIQCDTIGGFLTSKLPDRDRGQRDVAFGRAVARVLAHELFHALTGSVHHGGEDITRSAYNVNDLLTDEFPVEQHTIDALHSALLPLFTERSNRSGYKGDAAGGRELYQTAGCAACHGSNGEGSRQGPALRKPGRPPLAPLVLAGKLGKGIEKMYHSKRGRGPKPPVLNERQVVDLMCFLNTL